MKLLFSLLLVFILIFAGCDGKDRSRYTHQEKLKKSKLSGSFFEQVQYLPQDFTEVVTDTILSNGYHIKLKVYSDMNTSVLKEFKKDTITYKRYFRAFKGEVIITLNNEEIINKTLEKIQFSNNTDADFWKDAVLGNISLNYERSTDDEIFLNAFYRIPETNHYKDFNIVIASNGKIRIEELSAHVL
ncbi:MAG: hypothetical protein ACI83H_000724 [Glaciecola sp.]|jgi:hypothetical protein